jgi:hypothetical protein
MKLEEEVKREHRSYQWIEKISKSTLNYREERKLFRPIQRDLDNSDKWSLFEAKIQLNEHARVEKQRNYWKYFIVTPLIEN